MYQKMKAMDSIMQSFNFLKFNICFWYCANFKMTERGRPRVRDITLKINDMLGSYAISPKPIKLLFEIE